MTTRPGQPRVGLTSGYAVHVAYDDRTRARIREESERLAWASRQGIPVPKVHSVTDEWLISERARDDKAVGGADYVTAAIGAARAISGATEPPPSLRAPVAAHGGGRRAGAERLYRILRSPLSPREFRAARAESARLPRDTLAHGDFVLHNVLFDRGSASVTVIDWEYLT
ncbi:MAG: phosphotransferase, partial [Gemmatimonadales bacterium]